MPNGRPGDSRVHDILHHGLEVFGPSIDAMVRAVAPRLDAAERQAFLDLIETWPFGADAAPQQPENLMRRLEAWHARLGPAPPAAAASATPPPSEPVPHRRRGSSLAAVAGAVLGGGVGVPLGFVAFLALRETILPGRLWSSEPAMWAIIGATVLGGALLGALQGARPSRIGQALLIGLLGFLLGSLAVGLAAGALAIALGPALGVSQREGAYAMGVVFVIMPLAAVPGGALLAAWMGRRAWRSWRR